MSKKNKRKYWAERLDDICRRISPKANSNLNRELKDIDNDNKHKPKGQR